MLGTAVRGRTGARLQWAMLVITSCVLNPTRASSNPPSPNLPYSALNVHGVRGPVAFPHQVHEGLLNPDPSFPHVPAAGNTCLICHHKVKSTTASSDYQASRNATDLMATTITRLTKTDSSSAFARLHIAHA